MCSSLARPEISKSRAGVVRTNKVFNSVQVVNGALFGIIAIVPSVSICSE